MNTEVEQQLCQMIFCWLVFGGLLCFLLDILAGYLHKRTEKSSEKDRLNEPVKTVSRIYKL